MAANMSTSSAMMVDSGALFTQGVYRKLVSDRGDRHYLWVGRFSGFLITTVGVLYALFLIERVLYSFLLTETMATYMGISFLGGIVWRRANRYGAIASLVTAMAANFLIYHLRQETARPLGPVGLPRLAHRGDHRPGGGQPPHCPRAGGEPGGVLRAGSRPPPTPGRPRPRGRSPRPATSRSS